MATSRKVAPPARPVDVTERRGAGQFKVYIGAADGLEDALNGAYEQGYQLVDWWFVDETADFTGVPKVAAWWEMPAPDQCPCCGRSLVEDEPEGEPPA